MKNILNALWVKSAKPSGECEIYYTKEFASKKELVSATLEATALGVYTVHINGERVGDNILAPGWTSYRKRLQVDTHDVTAMIKNENKIVLSVAPGWKIQNYRNQQKGDPELGGKETAAICALTLEYADGEKRIITTGGDWKTEKGKDIYSSFYNGYIHNPEYKDINPSNAIVINHDKKCLIDREGEKVIEQERLEPKEIIITPKGETVLDFGQNLKSKATKAKEPLSAMRRCLMPREIFTPTTSEVQRLRQFLSATAKSISINQSITSSASDISDLKTGVMR